MKFRLPLIYDQLLVCLFAHYRSQFDSNSPNFTAHSRQRSGEELITFSRSLLQRSMSRV